MLSEQSEFLLFYSLTDSIKEAISPEFSRKLAESRE
jgi:hypothetical protein